MPWESFKTRFNKHYCPIDLQKRLEKEFLDLNQGKMSVVDYETEFNHKAQFATRFLTTEQERVDHFIDGLRSEIRDVIANRDISEFEKAVESARRHEHDLTRSDRNPAPPAKRPQTEAFTSNAPPPCSVCGKAHRGRCNTVRPEVRCHGCGEVGHVKPNCPRRDMTCYSSGAIGHRQRECPRSKPEKSKAFVRRPSTSGVAHQKEVPRVQARAFQITAEEARDKPDVVMGIFLVNSHPARILFDSSATNSFVSHTFARCLNFVPYVLAKSFYVDTADGTSMLADKVYKDCVATPIARTPYRLAPAEMKEMKNQLVHGYDESCVPANVVLVFIDDILVYSKSEADHVIRFLVTVRRLTRPKLKLKSWEQPKNASEIRSFLGLMGYYRRFIRDFSKISVPLTSLTQKDVKFEWGEVQENAFLVLKLCLSNAPVLALLEGSDDLVVYSDASKLGLGCVLMQRGNVKAEHQKPYGRLQPLDIPVWKWEELTMDFVTKLPKTSCLHNSIWVVVKRLTKSAHLLPVRES
ncbi:uncharacterized protein LOC112503929 [Cynara cardunculus var. scolymus]|uniref:uncharacterized protein LOC112503929 n=1 Tax=Cynara cardunculus var. scolymus TaxID=59895 RepID=UPI000D6234FC|nr:uncharacterized protein LOC112503929 [Cynara cardunculus var. scolymus]